MDVNIVRSSPPQEHILNKVWLHYSAAVSTMPALFGVAIFSKLANPATAGINRKFQFPLQQNGALTIVRSYHLHDSDDSKNEVERSGITISEYA